MILFTAGVISGHQSNSTHMLKKHVGAYVASLLAYAQAIGLIESHGGYRRLSPICQADEGIPVILNMFGRTPLRHRH